MVENKRLVGIVVIVFVLGGAITYLAAASRYSSLINEKASKIAQLESIAREKEVQAQSAGMRSEETVSHSAVTEDSISLCLTCHDLALTKGFHLPQTIMKIDAARGTRRRLCIDCHGPKGAPWSADVQMTELSDITYDASVGLNGLFSFPNKVPHGIHKKKLESGIIKCETCHEQDGAIVKPQADAERGQVLVCQNCKYHPEDGNYIKIHVEAGNKCTICHTGGVLQIHKEKTFKLGQVG